MRTLKEWRQKKSGKATYLQHADVVGVRNIYTDLARLGHDEDFEPMAEAEPTTSLPGSLDKIEEMARRVEQGQPLWHPDDVRTFDDARLVAIAGSHHVNLADAADDEAQSDEEE